MLVEKQFKNEICIISDMKIFNYTTLMFSGCAKVIIPPIEYQ